jgi:hypothetical protein
VLVDLADDYADEDAVDQVHAQAYAVTVPRGTHEASARGSEPGLTLISTPGLTPQAGALWCIGARMRTTICCLTQVELDS